jgi:hypothetical protein
MNHLTNLVNLRVAKDFSLFKRNILIWMSQQSFHGGGLSKCEKLEFFSWWVLNKKKLTQTTLAETKVAGRANAEKYLPTQRGWKIFRLGFQRKGEHVVLSDFWTKGVIYARFLEYFPYFFSLLWVFV